MIEGKTSEKVIRVKSLTQNVGRLPFNQDTENTSIRKSQYGRALNVLGVVITLLPLGLWKRGNTSHFLCTN